MKRKKKKRGKEGKSCSTTDPLKPLQKRGLELTNTTATGSRVEAVSLLESVEATWSKQASKSDRIDGEQLLAVRNSTRKLTEVGDARVGGLDLVGDAEDGRDLDERGRHDLAVEDGLAEVADGLGPQEAPAGGGGGRGRRGGRRGRGHVRRPPPRRRHSAPASPHLTPQLAQRQAGSSS